MTARKAGTLRQVLEDAREEEGCSRDSLTVLSSQVDPYRLDTDAGHRDGMWIAKQLNRAIGSKRRIHWRGLHYAIVAAGYIKKTNGEIYTNTDEDWLWLSSVAGKAARWLGHIDFERIIDNRNSEPIKHRKARVTPSTWVSVGLDVDIPDVDDLEPYPGVTGFEARQPYALVIFGEKTGLEPVVGPIAEQVEADLYLCGGEISDTQLYIMAKDGAADGRPMAVFTLTDCDPSGYQMSVSIGRKLQALRDLYFPSLVFEIVPVALTVAQVRELKLPSTPLKETERRADKWREAFGVEQTEIDALATLQPEVLRQILVDAIAPYYDTTLAGRVSEAESEWQIEAQERLNEQIDEDALGDIREQATERLAELKGAIDSINDQLRMATDGRFVLPEVVIPEPELDENLPRLALLISSAWSWVRQTRALISRKKYEGGK